MKTNKIKNDEKIEKVMTEVVIEEGTNETVKVENSETIEKVEMTLKELSLKVRIPEGTLRAAMMKPIDGIPYSANNINYEQLNKTILKYFPNFTAIHGFEAKKIVIVKAERSTKKWIGVEELEKLGFATKVVLHNYSLKTDLQFVEYLKSYDAYLFSTLESTYKVYTANELSKANIKIELK